MCNDNQHLADRIQAIETRLDALERAIAGPSAMPQAPPGEADDGSPHPSPPRRSPYEIPLKGGSTWIPSREDIYDWEMAYPGEDIYTHIREYAIWSKTDPYKRKTAKHIKKSVNFWICREARKNRAKKEQVEPPKTAADKEWRGK